MECFFDIILKTYFRILKLALAYKSQKSIDYVFPTCCILHNMLHTHGMDGLKEDVHWIGSANFQETWEHNEDTTSVRAKDINDRQ